MATALGYNNPRDAFKKHIDEEDKGVAKCDTLGGTQETTIINESGLYSLVLSSKLPTAKKFKRWVTNEVIPSIRKHGAYMTPETLEKVLLSPDTLMQLAQNLKDEQEKRRVLETKIEQDQAKGSLCRCRGKRENLYPDRGAGKALKTERCGHRSEPPV